MMMMATTSNNDPPVLPVSALLAATGLGLELVTGLEGLARGIKAAELQKPGLVLAGYLESLHPERVQVFGYSEVSYLRSLSEETASGRVRELCGRGIPCVIVTGGLTAPQLLIAACSERQIPLLRTALSSAEFIEHLRAFLASCLSPSSSLHGVLVDVFGVGILLLGKSGIGKSELALDLVMRGHRLVADDIVELRRETSDSIYGSGPDIIKHHMEIRGLGILNIKDLFGIAAVRDNKKVEVVVELVEWNEAEEYDRLGVDEQSYTIVGLNIPLIRLPVRPGRNMTSIIEVAARNQLLKVRGHHSAREFQERLVRAIAEGRTVPTPRSDVE
jgi:HPr kinase/phosphorylase